ncbi:hypothetical protein [Cellulomonas sp. SG140]|uniref:hypothetical protein n=1 Tax=Cellulomonas sp. SG140 TaxID=2976536 RepID=UPI0021E93818|nr:hypothetical protein [Cellulomonas sp. SG140]
MTRVDWDSIGERGFWAAERAAKAVASGYSSVEEDDVFQEAVIYLATHVEEMTKQADYGNSLPGIRGGETGARKAVAYLLTLRMRAWAQTQIDTRARELDAAVKQEERVDLTRWSNRPTPPGFEGMAYTPAVVETALPAIWDESMLAGVQGERGPSPDMPKASSDPSHSGTHMAHVADLRRAWRDAPLALAERRALFLKLSIGLTEQEIGSHEGCTQQAISHRLIRGLEKLTAHLNGREVPLSGTEH